MASVHTVKPGECLSAIAAKHGFRSWKILYDHPENAALRARRPDANVLHPGDRVHIPDKKPRLAPASTGAEHRYLAVSPRRSLRLRILDVLGEPVRNAPCLLFIDDLPQARPTSTDGAGEIEVRIAPLARRGRVEVGRLSWDLDIAGLNPIHETDDDGVSGAQGRLLNLGYDTGPLDGVLGPRTRAALRRFQGDHGLPPGGALDDDTRAALLGRHGC